MFPIYLLIKKHKLSWNLDVFDIIYILVYYVYNTPLI